LHLGAAANMGIAITNNAKTLFILNLQLTIYGLARKR